MNAKTALASAALFGSIAGALVVGSAAPASAQRIACASGYHSDNQGNCQPDNPQPNLQPCPPGLLSAPSPWSGYMCVPIPKGY
jgi:hypothetical protein